MWWNPGIWELRTWLCGFERRWDQDVISWNETLNPGWIKMRNEVRKNASPVDVWGTADVYAGQILPSGPCFGWSGCISQQLPPGAVLPHPPPLPHTPTPFKNAPCQQVDSHPLLSRCVSGRIQRRLCLSATRLQEFRFITLNFTSRPWAAVYALSDCLL